MVWVWRDLVDFGVKGERAGDLLGAPVAVRQGLNRAHLMGGRRVLAHTN